MKQCNGICGRTSDKLDIVRIAGVSWVTVNMSKRLDRSFTQSWARRRSPSHLLQGHEEMQAVLLSLSSTSCVCSETTLSPVNKNVDALKLSGNDFQNKCALSWVIRNNSAASKSRDLWHCFWRLSSEERKSVTPVHLSLRGNHLFPHYFYMLLLDWICLPLIFERKVWQAAKICRMHRKKWRKSCKGIREKPRVVLGSGMCLGLGLGKPSRTKLSVV